MSWRALTDHKLRSVLTTLGIVIGVGAIIALVSVSAGLQADVVQTLAGENTNLVYVSATSGDGESIPTLTRGAAVFTEHDVTMLSRVDGVEAIIPQSGIAASAVRYRNDSVGRQWITVTTPGHFDARGQAIIEGRTFVSGRHEVVINERAQEMFATNVSVGENLTIVRGATGKPINATVVGIVEGEEEEGPSIVSRANQPSIYVPPEPFYQRTVVSPTAETVQRVYPQLVIVVDGAASVDSVKGRSQTLLVEESDARILKPREYRFEVTTYDELVDQIDQITNTFTAYIVGIAVISLVVGAIGIANIMLANVAERRREIGIMRAIGGQNRDILQLFVNEAVLLGVIGAALGAILGLVGGFVAAELIGLPHVVDLWWLAVAVGVGITVGVVSGLYPAWNATRTDPIDALRRE